MLPMSAEAQFLPFFGAVLILGPKSPSPATGLPGVRWKYVKLGKAAAAHWRAVRGERAIFDSEWSPRMGVFWPGVKRRCIHSSVEKAPVLPSDAHELCRRAEISRSRLRRTVGEADLAPGGFGLRLMLEHAMTLRSAVSISLAFFGVRRASEIAGLRAADVKVNEAGGLVEIRVRRQKK